MKWRMFNRKISRTPALFNGHFIEVKALYALEFDAVSCISFIGDIDTSKAFALVNESMRTDVMEIYQHSYFDHNESKMFFNNTVFVLRHKRMIELGSNYCQILHTPYQHNWANEMIKSLSHFRIVNSEPVIGFARQTANN